jgi:hypothetical protein
LGSDSIGKFGFKRDEGKSDVIEIAVLRKHCLTRVFARAFFEAMHFMWNGERRKYGKLHLTLPKSGGQAVTLSG